jgi:hypothetical protein
MERIMDDTTPLAQGMRHAGSIAAALVAALLCVAASAATPNPVVTGPIAATVTPGDPARDYPFFSSAVNLAAQGYVEEEFFFAGTANKYAISDPLGTATIVPGSATPYKTRMIVRRPLSASDFNGTVVMEWQNVSATYDLDATWVVSSEHFLRRGYAWVGVSAQRVGVHSVPYGLKSWSPGRYATLNVPLTSPADALSYDIFSQAGQAVTQPQGVDPLGGLVPKELIAIGASQAANFLIPYYNSLHPLADVFDAFVIVSPTMGRLLRTDLDVKVWKFLTETDVAGNVQAKSEAWIRQPDSDHMRTWEVAGAAHLGYQPVEALKPLQVRDGVPVTMDRGAACDHPAFSRIPLKHVANAVFDHVADWVRFDVPPPHAPQIEVDALGAQISTLERDAFGNALGGIRLSQHAVATATNTGINFNTAAPLDFCRVFGSYVPFSEAMLADLYRNHGSYVSKVARTTEQNLEAGFIVVEDAEATITDAATSRFGKR